LALQALLELVLMGRLVPLEQLELVILAQRVLQAQVLLAPLAPLVQGLQALLGLVLMAQPARRASQASAEQQVLAALQGQPELTVQAVQLVPAEQSV
jgi:hypothetical protein